MLQKCLMSMLLIIMAPCKALALPGKSLAETQSYLQNHPFLMPLDLNDSIAITGFRFFNGNFWVRQMNFHDDGFIGSVDLSVKQFPKETIDTCLQQNLEQQFQCGDRAKTRNFPEFWSRTSSDTFKLLRKLYPPESSADIALDFKQSKLVYKATRYNVWRFRYEELLLEEALRYDDPLAYLTKETNVNHLKIYQGKKYTYIIDHQDVRSPDALWVLRSFEIHSLDAINKEIQAIKSANKFYNNVDFQIRQHMAKRNKAKALLNSKKGLGSLD